MKLYLTYGAEPCPAMDVAWFDEKHIKEHSYANLSGLAERATVTRLRSENVLDRLAPSEAFLALAHWMDLLAHGGEITLIVTDFESIARGYIRGEFGMDYVHSRLADRKSFQTLEGLTGVLKSRGLKIVTARVEGTLTVVVGKRS